MNKGIIFDIKEFAINDGPGIRLTIFMKGCPLRCLWCHNPEGLSQKPQINYKTGCVTGVEYSVEQIFNRVRKFKDIFQLSGGGITFSGGEPLMQADFVYDVASNLTDIHKTLDTSGFCNSQIFKKMLSIFNLIYYDIKLVNDDLHQKFTGVSNKIILENLKILERSGVPYHIRIPLIPNITDTKDNLNDIKNLILSLENRPLRVDALPYNALAGGKYDSYNMEYPLKDINDVSNIENLKEFNQALTQNKIEIIGEEVKCLQKN